MVYECANPDCRAFYRVCPSRAGGCCCRRCARLLEARWRHRAAHEAATLLARLIAGAEFELAFNAPR